MKVILVAGTHSWRGRAADWYNPSPPSPFVTYLASLGVSLLEPDRPYIWDTNVGGVGFGDDDLLGWKAAGINLFYYVVPPLYPALWLAPRETVVISHSHGLQPTLWAAAEGLRINLLIDVAGPVRKDMLPVAERARPNIGRWVHIHAGRRDWWQVWGGLFDGHLGVVREHPLADLNLPVPAADHGDVLRTPAYFPIIGQALGLAGV